MSEEMGVRERARFSSRRLGVAALTALVVLSIALYATGDTARTSLELGADAKITRKWMKTVEAAIGKYRTKHGRSPRSLKELHFQLQDGLYVPPDGIPEDRWNRPLMYTLHGSAHSLRSLGRDGKPGGRGLDADIHGDQLDEAGIEFSFPDLIGDPNAQKMVLSSFLAAAVAFGLVLLTTSPGDFSGRRFCLLAGKMLAAGLATVAMAGVLIYLHIPWGH